MKYFLHLKTTFDAFLEGNTLALGLITKNNTIHLEVRENYPITFKVFPINKKEDHKALLPYAVTINYNHNLFELEGENVTVTDFKNKHYELLFLKNQVTFHDTLEVLKQTTYSILSASHTATLFYDGIYQVSIQDKELIFTHNIDACIKNGTIAKIKNKDVIVIKANTKWNETYILILGYHNNAYTILKEGIVNKIEYGADTLTLLTKQKDMAGHGIVEAFKIEGHNLTLEETYVVYTQEKPKITTIKELIPFAFLEAVKVKNYSLAREYLTQELNASLQEEHFNAYFGDYEEVVSAKYEEEIKNKICLIYKNKIRSAKTFLVEFDKNKISNFLEV